MFDFSFSLFYFYVGINIDGVNLAVLKRMFFVLFVLHLDQVFLFWKGSGYSAKTLIGHKQKE